MLGIFSGNLLRGEPITIFGDGEQTRDFVYIDDIVEGWVRALTRRRRAAASSISAAGARLSINELAAHAIAAFGHAPGGYPIVRARRPGPASSARCRPTLRLAKSVLGWEPRTPFETGLAETMRWARKEFAASTPQAPRLGAAR